MTTKQDFAEQVLTGIGAPVSASNVSKLVLWFQHESGGGGGAFNPLDYVVTAPGSTSFNSVGVQNYPDVGVGVAQTVRLLNQANTQAIRSNLQTDAPWSDFLRAVVSFNAPWTSSAWQSGVLSASEADAQKYWSTGINGDTSSSSSSTPPGVAATLLSARATSSGLLPSPSDLAGALTSGLLAGGLNVTSDFLSGNGILGKLNPISDVTDWLTKSLPKIVLIAVAAIGGVALIVLGAGRAVAPTFQPVADKAQTAAPIVAAAL
jgi:hypothetical protein